MKHIQEFNNWLNENEVIDKKIGKVFWFEYHCFESPKSGDAEVWYHSHQKVLVLSIAEYGIGDNKEERLMDGCPRVYKVQFEDGLEWDVFEDELLDSPNDFCRPNPPVKILNKTNLF